MQMFKFDTLLGILVLYNEKMKNICFCLLDRELFGNSCRAWVFFFCVLLLAEVFMRILAVLAQTWP